MPFWPTEDEVRSFWLPKLQEAGAKWGSDPKLAAFTFAYVAEDESDFQANLPNLRNGVTFNDPSVDPLAVTISGSPARCADRMNALMAAGISHFVTEFQFHGLETVSFGMKQMEKFASEVGPLL